MHFVVSFLQILPDYFFEKDCIFPTGIFTALWLKNQFVLQNKTRAKGPGFMLLFR